MKSLGEAIRKARTNLHMSLKETGEMIGCSASMVSRYESGHKPSDSMKKIILDKLGIEDLGDKFVVATISSQLRLKVAIQSLKEKCENEGISWREYAEKHTINGYTLAEIMGIFAALAYLIDGDVISSYNEKNDTYLEEIPTGLIENVSATEQKTTGTDEGESGTEKTDSSELFSDSFFET